MTTHDPNQPPSPHSEEANLPQNGSIPQALPLEPGQSIPEDFPVQMAQPAAGAVPSAQGGSRALPRARAIDPAGQATGTNRPAAARPILVRGSSAVHAIRKEQDASEPEEITAIALRTAPPWLVSAVFHMVLMIVLALMLLPQLANHRIELQTLWAETLGSQLDVDSFLAGSDPEAVEEPLLTPDNLPEVADPFAAPTQVDLFPGGLTAASDLNAPQIGFALTGREEGRKRALLGAYGGTKTTETAVALGLKWLADHQQKDGSWSLTGKKGQAKTLYTNGAIAENRLAATAMALLAFQGAGNTHTKGKYAKNVAAGWKWLLAQQADEGNFFREGDGGFNHRFYTEGQCAIALCELYGMTKDYQFQEPAERIVEYCLRTQSSEGGWRYVPGIGSDVSVTGWIMMGLQSARMAGLEVPDENLRRVERFLENIAEADGARYPYQFTDDVQLSMTAEALLCGQYLGWSRYDPRLVEGVDWLTQPENLIDYQNTWPDRFVYYWYYATQVTHHMGGDYWKRWNDVMRQEVPAHQVTKGKEAGSWDPGTADRAGPQGYDWHGQFAPYGGRLYVTCLSIYMLEVYYRHLPIYSDVFR